MSVTPSKIQRLMDRFKSKCVFCDSTVYVVTGKAWDATPPHRRATCDHALPKCRGGLNGDENCLLACAACNGAKSHMTDAEFLSFIATGKLPISYLRFLVLKMRQTMMKQIPHVAIPVEGLTSPVQEATQ